MITECRESLKKNWITHFALPECDTRDTALHALRDHAAFKTKQIEFTDRTAPDALTERFSSTLDELTGGHDPLVFGHGRWLERLRGKHVMPTVVKRCFKIPDASGNLLQGPDKQVELAKELLRRPISQQPQDLQDLRALISTRLQK